MKRIIELVEDKSYDNVVFHRVIEGFMAQTGDVQFGNKLQDFQRIAVAWVVLVNQI